MQSRTIFHHSQLLATMAVIALFAAPARVAAQPREPGSSPHIMEPQPRFTEPPSTRKLVFEISPFIGVETLAAWERDDVMLKIGGDIRLLWMEHSRNWGMGVRLAASSGLHDLFNLDTGFLMKFDWFWFSTGLSLVKYRRNIAPEFNLALGLDIPLGQYLALRVQASGATLLFFWQAALSGGVVVRF